MPAIAQTCRGSETVSLCALSSKSSESAISVSKIPVTTLSAGAALCKGALPPDVAVSRATRAMLARTDVGPNSPANKNA